jgi:hypothetical protein
MKPPSPCDGAIINQIPDLLNQSAPCPPFDSSALRFKILLGTPLVLERNEMPKKADKITIEKEKLRPRERAPILPTKKFEDKRRREERREKHKKNLRRIIDET